MSSLWQIESFDKENPLPHDGEWIDLLTPEEFARLPDGTLLLSINGKEAIKGRDYIDDDLRGGHMAYGTAVADG